MLLHYCFYFSILRKINSRFADFRVGELPILLIAGMLAPWLLQRRCPFWVFLVVKFLLLRALKLELYLTGKCPVHRLRK